MESSKEALGKRTRTIRQTPAQKRSANAMRVALICVVTVLCGALAFFLYNRKGRTTTSEKGYSAFSSTASTALPEMPAGVTQGDFQTLDGGSLRLANLAGKVVVLDLWATWCGPCRSEIPHLVQLGKDYKDRGVEVIGLTTENPTAAAQKVRDFVREFQIDYTIGWAGNLGPALMQGNSSIPQKFVITRDGRLMKRVIGFNKQTGTAQLREAVEQALRLGSGEQVATEVKPLPAAVPSDGVRRISVEELRAALAKGEAVVLDVRPEAQYKAGHIQGTLWIPDNHINDRFKEVPGDKLIVTYCS